MRNIRRRLLVMSTIHAMTAAAEISHSRWLSYNADP
jgi:hypothetical protein